MPQTEQKLTKKAFIAELPDDLPNKEVIARGKAKGIKLTAKQVANIRWAVRRAPRSKGRPKTNGIAAHNGHAAPVPTVEFKGKMRVRKTAEASTREFRAVVMELGLLNARALLEEMERALYSS